MDLFQSAKTASQESRPTKIKTAWLVPTLIEGSGGHRTILQNAHFLLETGFSVVLYLETSSGIDSGKTGKDAIERIFGYAFEDVRVGWDNISPADAVFATIWYSALVVRDLNFICKKFYFIQDWEAYFNPLGGTYLFAEQSYRYGLIPITIGKWLCVKLKSTFNLNARHFDFCADAAIYHPIPTTKRERSIVFICQPEKPRRCSSLGLQALSIVHQKHPEVNIIIFGSTQNSRIWFNHQNFGLLSLTECNRLYNKATLGLCISSSNPSRVPFEMMAAGLPVVEIHRENTLYDLPETACLLCDPTPEALAEGMIMLISDEKRCKEMSLAAIKFMAQRRLEYGYQQFADALVEGMNLPKAAFPYQNHDRIYLSPPITTDLTLATIHKNRGLSLHSDQRHTYSLTDRLLKSLGLLVQKLRTRIHKAHERKIS